MATSFERLADFFRSDAFLAERQELMQQVVLIALANSQKRAPVKTGTLRRSLTTRVEDAGLRGFVGTNVRYAPFVHEGTRFMAARPFIAEGIQESRAQIDRLLQDAGERFLAKAGT